MKKIASALLGLMALSVAVHCGDRDEDEEDERRIKLSAPIHTQEQPFESSNRNLTSPNYL